MNGSMHSLQTCIICHSYINTGSKWKRNVWSDYYAVYNAQSIIILHSQPSHLSGNNWKHIWACLDTPAKMPGSILSNCVREETAHQARESRKWPNHLLEAETWYFVLLCVGLAEAYFKHSCPMLGSFFISQKDKLSGWNSSAKIGRCWFNRGEGLSVECHLYG